MTRALRMTRRRMILGGSLVGGALVVGYTATHPLQVAGALMQAGGPDPEPSVFGPFIRIGPDGWVTIVNRQQELGQGIHAGIAAIVAEELDADWDRVRVVAADGNLRAYGVQMTAGSNAIANNWDDMRHAGAAARSMFVAAAAERWKVPPLEVTVRDGVVSHLASGRSIPFSGLLRAAALQEPSQEPTLKQLAQYRLIGSDRVRRKDCRPKVDGTLVYTQDVRLPGMLVAMVAHSPRFGGTLARFDDAMARMVSGVVDVFAIQTGVAVVAENTFAARRGRDALRIEWNDSDAELRSSAALEGYYHEIAAGRTEHEASNFQSTGDDPAAPFTGDVAEFAFDFPYLAHAPMEPLDCVAQVNDWDVVLHSGAHLVTVDQVQAALAARTIPGRVNIKVLPAGGSFGRRGLMSSDYLVECVRIAQRTGGRPVKLIWTREDEMAGGYYRPMSHHRAWVKLRPDGYPDRWRFHSVCQPLVPFGSNEQATEGITESPYFSTAQSVEGKISSPTLPVTVSFLRSVGHAHTAMIMEHIVDQLARRAGIDPAVYRRTLFQRAGAERHLAVLEELVAHSGWGGAIDKGWARGMAIHEAFGTVLGQVAEVRMDGDRPTVRRVVAVVDCGIAVSPDQIAAQMEGGIGFGLSAALFGAVTLRDGHVQQTNFDTYPLVRMNEMPSVETHIVASTRRPSGMGEPGVTPIAPAVANAMLALTGRATVRLPILGESASNAGSTLPLAASIHSRRISEKAT